MGCVGSTMDRLQVNSGFSVGFTLVIFNPLALAYTACVIVLAAVTRGLSEQQGIFDDDGITDHPGRPRYKGSGPRVLTIYVISTLFR